MRKGRRLAFDYGDVRIGVAVSDQEAILASAVTTLQAQDEHLWVKILDLIDEYQPIEIYVGNPVHLSGSSSESSAKAKDFAQEITTRFKTSTVLIDERMSTVSAQGQLRTSGKNSREMKEMIDQVAAVAILEQGMEIERHRDRLQ
ncbi:unannotated protein [freshwater metagenome]|uniref:Unannotated protein n=1 Tax=freshwater metagenome TaxID=449393 RepID=A0A6J7FG45_9ZZZZ|nr:Holliday junction resolvase RuvX [Actinomycetota bacterium]MSV86542.1 Holliday junction resolvase RuvX [Actinomycetota bacterium]MSW67522.1 Holliday junction resolvase RuvX [Actinomycetota bacterium]MSX27877.1 Holliday junction resolvase RuvX [Actinomycetota bacterium]MSY03235.1 Holliday junction resolvase RuvX [Actinomycetota bacterium]